ncbi:hypothetical protein KVJ89_04065 [Helicobacter pylori]|nr:hypothetical protein KVJ89_04065 [Helicobacter pylori]
MKTIRKIACLLERLYFGGCASVGTHFDALRVACVKDACLYRKKHSTRPKTLIALILAIKLILGFRWV